MKVRRNAVYTFIPRGCDVVMPEHYSAVKGQRVRVIQLPLAPGPNTLGQCHIESLDGQFLGMVATVSLER